MSAVRSLRLCQHLTLTELALQAGVPARTIAEIEHGLRRLDPEVCGRLAVALGLSPHALARSATLPVPDGASTTVRQRALALALTSLVGAALLMPVPATTPFAPVDPPFSLPAPATPPAILPTPVPVLPASPPRPLFPPQPLASVSDDVVGFLPQRFALAPAALVREPPASHKAPPLFALLDDGPHGCPLPGAVMITQGFGVGTHAPAAIWGAVDLALGGPEVTRGAEVIATHDGVAHIYSETWPGGNVVMVYHHSGIWTTLYAHLETFEVTDGQEVTAGTLIGRVGSTGMSTGPHLHYEVRSPDGNIDPAPLIGCVLP